MYSLYTCEHVDKYGWTLNIIVQSVTNIPWDTMSDFTQQTMVIGPIMQYLADHITSQYGHVYLYDDVHPFWIKVYECIYETKLNEAVIWKNKTKFQTKICKLIPEFVPKQSMWNVFSPCGMPFPTIDI